MLTGGRDYCERLCVCLLDSYTWQILCVSRHGKMGSLLGVSCRQSHPYRQRYLHEVARCTHVEGQKHWLANQVTYLYLSRCDACNGCLSRRVHCRRSGLLKMMLAGMRSCWTNSGLTVFQTVHRYRIVLDNLITAGAGNERYILLLEKGFFMLERKVAMSKLSHSDTTLGTAWCLLSFNFAKRRVAHRFAD